VLSVSDPAFIETIYSQNPKHDRERYWTVTRTLQADGSMLGSRGHALHRQRRAQLNSYFSQQNVRRLEPMINDTLGNLFSRMEQWGESEEIVHMNVPYRAATKDIIQVC
jgi:cytochrome P450